MKKLLLLLVPLLLLGGAGFWYYGRDGREAVQPYRFVTVERGDLEAIVSSTGTLRPVTTVQVGTQVSGRIDRLFVDFNDRVRRGQLLAFIDTTLLVSAIRDAEANLDRSHAQLAQAEREHRRLGELFEKKVITDVEYNQAVYNLEVARATVKSSSVNLERARQNLQYASIRAPMDGTVVERNVDVGQTVAASFSAPQLFLIANDLTQMQILADVDESDIGRIVDGQEARFTVQAYPDRTFRGTVRQIRLQPTTEQNVVTYTVVVDVRNPDGLLLPGMTATVEFLIEHTEGVLKVPNAALRFRPTPEMWEAFQRQTETRRVNAPDSVRQRWQQRRESGDPDGGSGGPNGGSGPQGSRGGPGATMLWFLDADGNVTARRIRTGITDGQMTQVEGAGIEEGLQVITGVQQSAAAQGAASPFQQPQQQRFGPGRGM